MRGSVTQWVGVAALLLASDLTLQVVVVDGQAIGSHLVEHVARVVVVIPSHPGGIQCREALARQAPFASLFDDLPESVIDDRLAALHEIGAVEIHVECIGELAEGVVSVAPLQPLVVDPQWTEVGIDRLRLLDHAAGVIVGAQLDVALRIRGAEEIAPGVVGLQGLARVLRLRRGAHQPNGPPEGIQSHGRDGGFSHLVAERINGAFAIRSNRRHQTRGLGHLKELAQRVGAHGRDIARSIRDAQ